MHNSKRSFLSKVTLAVGLLLVLWLFGVPWITGLVYLKSSRPAPELTQPRITPENAVRIKLLDQWAQGEVLDQDYTLDQIYWNSPSEGRLLAWREDVLELSTFPQGQQLHTWQADPPMDGATWRAQFSQDGRFVVAQYGNRVRAYDAQNGKALGPWLYASDLFALSPNGALLACAGTLGLSEDPSRVDVYYTHDGSRAALFKTRAFYWRDLLYSPDGKLLVALGDDGQRTYAWIGHTPVFRWLEPTGYRAAFSPDGMALATARTIVFLDQHRTVLLEYSPPEQTPFEVTFSPAGDVLVTQTLEGGLYIWRVFDGMLLAWHRIPEGMASIAFSPDGAWFTVLLGGSVYRYGLSIYR